MVTKRTEQFQDYISRLFPKEHISTSIHNDGLSRTITFQVTDRCSLACSYCYEVNKSNHSMSFEVAKRFVDIILSATSESCDYINPDISEGLVVEFIGGEPLLEIDLIDKTTDYLVSEMFRLRHKWATRYMISICSNGVAYFDERVQRYLKKHFNHLSFSISIDGNKELHDSCRVFPDGRGSYDIAIAGVKHFTEVLGGKMGSKMTLCPANIDKTFSAVKSLIEFGYREINLNCVYEQGWTVEHARIMYEQLKQLADYVIDNGLFDKIYLSIFEENFFKPKSPEENENWCGGTGCMLSCDWKGDLYPCIRYMESSLGDSQKPIVIGDVYTGLVKTEEQKNTVVCLNCITRRSQSTDECFNCPIAEGCAWCSAYNYQVFGTADKRATFICVTHKARALANLYFWNKGYRNIKSTKRMKSYIPDDWALEIISGDELQILKEMEVVDGY